MQYLYLMRFSVSLFGVSYTHPARFTSVFYTFFCCFNARRQFTPLLNLRPLISGLTHIAWMHSIMLSQYLRREYHFWFTSFWFTPTVSGWQLGRRIVWAYYKSSWLQRIIMCVMNISHRKGIKIWTGRQWETIEWYFRAAAYVSVLHKYIVKKFRVSEPTGNC